MNVQILCAETPHVGGERQKQIAPKTVLQLVKGTTSRPLRRGGGVIVAIPQTHDLDPFLTLGARGGGMPYDDPVACSVACTLALCT